ncbi:hypothetical protein ACROYT_G004463 [Oculina patagonica]
MFNIRKWIWGDSIVSNVVFEESLFVTGNNSIYSVKHRTVRGAYKYSPSVGFSAFPYQPHRGKRHPVFKKTISSLSLLFGKLLQNRIAFTQRKKAKDIRNEGFLCYGRLPSSRRHYHHSRPVFPTTNSKAESRQQWLC